jgi:hypothetical protein
MMPVGESAITALANLTLSSGQATVTFSSISTSFRDLRLVITGTTTGTAFFRINGDSTTKYNFAGIEGNTTSVQPTFVLDSSTADAAWNISAFDSGGVGTWNCDFFDYAQTDKHKLALTRLTLERATSLFHYRYANTAAITSIAFTSSTTWGAGTTFTLYGLSA